MARKGPGFSRGHVLLPVPADTVTPTYAKAEASDTSMRRVQEEKDKV